MQFKKFDNKYIVRMDRGEEIVQTLKNFCAQNNIKLGSISGIGAVSKVTIGLFEIATKKYHSQEFTGDYEITSLNGNITSLNGDVYLHLHMNISDSSYNTRGGHLTSATISATGEFIIESIDGNVEREFSEEIGINLIKF